MSSYKRLVFGLLLIAVAFAAYVVGFGAGWNFGLPTKHPLPAGSVVTRSSSGELTLQIGTPLPGANAFSVPSISQDGCVVTCSIVSFPGTPFTSSGEMHLMMEWQESTFRKECPAGEIKFVTQNKQRETVTISRK